MPPFEMIERQLIDISIAELCRANDIWCQAEVQQAVQEDDRPPLLAVLSQSAAACRIQAQVPSEVAGKEVSIMLCAEPTRRRDAPAREKNAMLTTGVRSARIWPISSCTPLLAASPLHAYRAHCSEQGHTRPL